jgi:phospholipid-binding lipoprotein MlaA
MSGCKEAPAGARGVGRSGGRAVLGLALLLSGVTVSGCATKPAANNPQEIAAYNAANDPWEPMNRKVFAFDMALDRYVFKPVAKGYRAALPQPARNSVRGVLDTWHAPITIVNALLQGNANRAFASFGRAVVNATLGFGGLFDPATDMGIPKYQEDFGQTLGVWGVDEGPYLVLPFLGPKPPRDAIGFAADSVTDPSFWVFNGFWAPAGITVVDLVDERSRNIENLDEIQRTSLDFYAAVRSLYRQHRDAEIRNGAAASTTPSYSPSDFQFDDNVDPAGPGT